MKRGEIWTLRGSGYASKARPALIVQSDDIDDFNSRIVAFLSSFDSSDFPSRILLEPTELNGLRKNSYVMTDKLIAVPKEDFGKKIGAIDSKGMEKVSQSIKAVLGL